MRDDASIVPYTGIWYHGVFSFPFGRNMDSGSQGRDLSLPRVFAAAQGSGGMRASRPTVVPYVPHHPGNSHVSGAKKPCRGGFHIRPGCEPGRYRIGPYMGDAPPQWPRPLRWPQGRDLSLPRAFAAAQGSGGNVPGFEFQRCGGRERPPYGTRETCQLHRKIAALRCIVPL